MPAAACARSSSSHTMAFARMTREGEARNDDRLATSPNVRLRVVNAGNGMFVWSLELSVRSRRSSVRHGQPQPLAHPRPSTRLQSRHGAPCTPGTHTSVTHHNVKLARYEYQEGEEKREREAYTYSAPAVLGDDHGRGTSMEKRRGRVECQRHGHALHVVVAATVADA